VLQDSRRNFHGTPSPSPHSSSHGRWKWGVLIGLVLTSCAEDRGNPIPNPGDGQSLGKLPSSTAAADQLTLQERRETYISSSESEEEEEGEEEEDDTVTNSARSNYLQPRIIPVY